MTDTGLDEVLNDAQELSEEAQKKIEQAENEILEQTNQMVADGIITEDEAGTINKEARNRNFDKAMDLIEKHLEENTLSFEDEEKQLFAEAFQDGFQELLNQVEAMQDDLSSLQKGASRNDLKQYLRGKKTKRRKKDVDQVFKAIDSLKSSGNSDKKIARALTGFNSNLTISETQEMIEEIREKVESHE